MGDESRSGHPLNDEQARREREGALHALAGQSPPAPSVEAPTLTRALPPMGLPRGRARPILFVLLIACVIIVSGVGWWRFSRSAPSPAGGLVTVTFPNAELGCADTVAWSPDSRRVAILGYSRCPTQNGPPATDPQVVIYDPATWRAVSTIHLDPLITSAVKPLVALPSARADPAVLQTIDAHPDYFLAWSPDSQRVAVRVYVDATSLANAGGSRALTWHAMLVIAVATPTAQAARAAVWPVPQHPVYPSGSSFEPSSALRWNLDAGDTTITPLPQALGYAWEPDGRLRVTAPLPTSWQATPTVPPLGPVGQPLGGASFSLWQQAQVRYNTEFCAGPFFPVQLSTPAWSPDGRYLYESLGVGARFPGAALPVGQVPTPESGTCVPLPTEPSVDLGPNFLAPLPIRDAGLAAALATFAKEAPDGRLDLAWSRDGQRLTMEEIPGLNPTTWHIAIYACASGQVLARYTPQQLKLPASLDLVPEFTLQWAPDGKRLLLASESRVIVLSGASLGA